jgi:hypothetical protein
LSNLFFRIVNSSNAATRKLSLPKLRSAVKGFLKNKAQANQEILRSLSRLGTPKRSHFPTDRDSIYAARQVAGHSLTLQARSEEVSPQPLQRFSVVYKVKEQPKHRTYPSREQAQAAQETLLSNREVKILGIYDDKTELFIWELTLRKQYDQASFKEQGIQGEEAVRLAKALRRGDASGYSDESPRPSLFL